MAADVSARMFQQPTPEQQRSLDEMAATGVEITPVTELLSMASAAKTMDPLLVSLKAVDPTRYPFYGTVDLEPAGRLRMCCGRIRWWWRTTCWCGCACMWATS